MNHSYYPYQQHYHHPFCCYNHQHYYGIQDERQAQPNNVWRLEEERRVIPIKDYGKTPFVVDIEDVTEANNTFRTALWTGNHLQLVLMSLNVGEDIGQEVHENHDQFLKIEEGQALVRMGDTEHNLTFERQVDDDDAIIVPAGQWHNIINVGQKPLKLYTIYAPPEHAYGTVEQTKG